MDQVTITLIIIITIGLVFFLFRKSKKTNLNTKDKPTLPSNMLVLQGYERMITLAERIGFAKLIDRLSSNQLGAAEQADVYIEAIKNEYEYNLSQQIYISDKSWQMVSDFKDQQIYIIKQLINAIPQNANSKDLANAMTEFLKADEKASLQSLVLENLRFEARQYI